MALPEPKLVDLRAILADLLVKGPLYKKYAYNYSSAHMVEPARSLGVTTSAWLPKNIKTYCDGPNCEQETMWEVAEDRVYFTLDPFHRAEYVCRNCGKKSINYWFLWTESERRFSVFQKVGQFPPLSIEPSPELAKALGDEDTALYKKALINGNFSFGLGALSYLRRVVENKVNMLLDLIAEAAKLSNFESQELPRIEEVKNSHRLDTKIEYASKILPPHLRPGGHNPMDKLYAVASAGIHSKSDEECLDFFQDARFEFEYLFKHLTVTNEEAREFIKRASSKPGERVPA